jgi:uncharacterized membrane protein YdbT with pleckstrin-like domain
MSAYVESVLAAGENVIYRAAISSWKYFLSYAGGILLIVGGGAVMYYAPFPEPWTRVAGIVLFSVGLATLFSALLRQRTTELVLTDRRIIAKRGIMARDTVEMNLSKVESLHVSQGIMGRMLDYGDVAVVGTGSSLEPLRGVSHPLELRRKLGELADLPVLRRPAEPATVPNYGG